MSTTSTTIASSPTPSPSALTTLLSTQSSSTLLSPTTALPLEILHNLRHQHSWTDLHLHLHHHSSSSSSNSKSSPPKDDGSLHPSISDLVLTPASTTNTENPHPPPANSNPTPPTTFNPPMTLLSGLPPKPLYTHPDLQRKLLKAGIVESSLPPQREWVVPTTLARKWTLAELCAVFDALPKRPLRRVEGPTPMPTSASPAAGGAEEERMQEEGVKERRAVGGGGGGGGGEEAAAAAAKLRASKPITVEQQDAKRVLLAMKAHDGMGGDGTVVYYIVQEGEVKPRQN